MFKLVMILVEGAQSKNWIAQNHSNNEVKRPENKENSIGLVVIEILSYRPKKILLNSTK